MRLRRLRGGRRGSAGRVEAVRPGGSATESAEFLLCEGLLRLGYRRIVRLEFAPLPLFHFALPLLSFHLFPPLLLAQRVLGRVA